MKTVGITDFHSHNSFLVRWIGRFAMTMTCLKYSIVKSATTKKIKGKYRFLKCIKRKTTGEINLR